MDGYSRTAGIPSQNDRNGEGVGMRDSAVPPYPPQCLQPPIELVVSAAVASLSQMFLPIGTHDATPVGVGCVPRCEKNYFHPTRTRKTGVGCGGRRRKT